MPRSIWNGTLSLGALAVPVKVNSATEDRAVHFHQVHASDGVRLRQRRICSKEAREVPYKEIAKGYEVAPGEYVLLSAEEIAAAAGEQSHAIELTEFVCAAEIDPVFYERTYYLAGGDGGEGAYRLLHDALERCQRVGIGRWVFHNREYLVAVRALTGVLALHTMRFADELVGVDELDVPEPSRAPSEREIDMAVSLVDALHGDFQPDNWSDTYRERLLEMIARKARGEEIETPLKAEPEEAPDLLAALEASLAAHDGHGKGRRSGASQDGRSPASTKGTRSGSGRGSSSRGRTRSGRGR